MTIWDDCLVGINDSKATPLAKANALAFVEAAKRAGAPLPTSGPKPIGRENAGLAVCWEGDRAGRPWSRSVEFNAYGTTQIVERSVTNVGPAPFDTVGYKTLADFVRDNWS